MPLFEWHISATDTTLSVEAQFVTTKLRSALNNEFYVNGGFSIMNSLCSSENLGITFRRSERDVAIERVALAIDETITPRLFTGYLAALIPLVCIIYIWLFTILYKRPVGEAIAFSTVAVTALCFLIDLWKLLFVKVGPAFGNPCPGPFLSYPATFNAVLSKTHYETWILFSIGVLLEVGAFGEMLLQIWRAIFRRIVPSQSAVG
jgi:hypothetical protein